MKDVTPITRTTRDNFDPLYVLDLIQEKKLTKNEAIRILEEACHLIARHRANHSLILRWYGNAPWRQDEEKK